MTRLILFPIAIMFFLGAGAVTAQPGGSTLPVALNGYDPVAYFTEKRARLGDTRYQLRWDGARYQFASQKHLQMFVADPERYLPQYNNWCAASVAKGAKVHGNPEYWVVLDNKLYLFGKPIGPGMMRDDPVAMRSQADIRWPDVVKLPAPKLQPGT